MPKTVICNNTLPKNDSCTAIDLVTAARRRPTLKGTEHDVFQLKRFVKTKNEGAAQEEGTWLSPAAQRGQRQMLAL